ncbi:MAG: WD40 repeat domain-containing protein, partial [bacterium]|nr:WD40 repeat domain-containing protein [bacterium]
SDNRMLLFLQDASNGDWKVLFIDTSTGTTQVFQQLGSFYENSYLSQEVRVDWSPNGRYAAFSSTKRRKSQLLLLDTYQGTVRSIDWGGAYVYKVEWSFDSSGFLFHAPSLEHTFLSAGSWSVFHYNITTMVVDTLSPQAATWLQIEWSPAGRYIVASTSPPSGQVRSPFNLYLWDTVRDSQVTLTQNADTYLDYTWSPDGRYLAWTYEKDEIFEYRLLDVSLGTQHLLLATQNFRSGLYWIDSNQLMIGVQNETDHFIYIVDVLTGEMRRSGSLRNISSWSLSPDNRYLIAVNSSLQSRGNDLLDLFTLEATLLSEHPGNEVERAWSPDGERYVFVGEDDGYDLYIVDLPCLCVRRVTQTFLEEAVPLWVR